MRPITEQTSRFPGSHEPGVSPAQPFAIDAADLVVGLGRGLALIEAFDDEHPRLSIAQAAERTGVPRSAARRHLLSLCHFGYAETDGKLFWLSPRVLRLGQSYLGAARLPRLVQPFIQRLSAATGETVNVSVLDGHEVVYVARSNSPRLVSIGFHAGARAPAHVVTPGVVLLASLDDAALAEWAQAHDFTRFNAHTQTDAAAFIARVQAARAEGWWILEQQLDTGLTGVALALKDSRGRCHGAVGMTLQVAAWPRAEIEARLLPALHELARTLRPLL